MTKGKLGLEKISISDTIADKMTKCLSVDSATNGHSYALGPIEPITTMVFGLVDSGIEMISMQSIWEQMGVPISSDSIILSSLLLYLYSLHYLF